MPITKLLQWVAAPALLVAIGACGNLNTAYRSESDDGLKAISVDAKQRFVFINTAADGKRTIVCPEPSPDALSAGSVSLSIDASKVSVADLKAALGTSEQASSIGLRTQSIQLLRDQLAYLCLLRLADVNADKDPSQYLLLFKRYQTAVLGVLAIEQLTGAVKAPAVTVSASGSATVNVGAAAKPADAASQPDAASDAPSAPDSPATGASEPTGGAAAGSSKAKAMKSASAAAAPASGTAAKAANKKAGATSAAGSAPVSATTSVGVPVKADTPSNAARSDMAVVSDTVFKIVQLIVTTAFKDENCFSANSDPKSTEALVRGCSPPQERDQCVQGGTPLSTCNARAATNEAQRDIQAGIASAAPQDRDRVVADAAAKLQLKYNIPVSVDVPFTAMRFGIFRCTGTDSKYTALMTSQLTNAGAPADRINDRGEFSKDDLVAKGFSTSSPAEVLFDADIASEVNARVQFVGAAQAVLNAIKPPGRATSRANAKDKTPLYMSVAFCDG